MTDMLYKKQSVTFKFVMIWILVQYALKSTWDISETRLAVTQ